MDSPSPSRHSAYSAKNSFVDVSQLDKVNAIPNKTADNVLLSNLCPDDQHYLKFLMENDSSTSEDELEQARRNSSGAWSPMIQSPVMSSKRSRALKPSYAITLSLEDISYIRPSWGISKGIRTIEVDGAKKRNRKKQLEAEAAQAKDPASDVAGAGAAKTANDGEITYKYFLLLLTIVVVFITLPPYWAEQRRLSDQINRNKVTVDKTARTIEFYRPSPLHQQPLGEPILRLDFGQGIPRNLKPEDCSCSVFQAELARRIPSVEFSRSESENFCSSCLDWAVRANLRVLVEHQNEEISESSSICYSIKWQSYDSLATPLIDCFSVVDRNDQWSGLGDIRSAAEWPLNRINFDNWTPLVTNLTGEFASSPSHNQTNQEAPSFGSHANFTLFSASGISISELRSDFRLYLKRDSENERKICIRASCNERCGRVWSRAEYFSASSRSINNILEYRICSSSGGTKSLMANRLDRRVKCLDSLVKEQSSQQDGSKLATPSSDPNQQFDRLLVERESHQTAAKLNSTSMLPEGIGLIDRTIFMTSAEFMPVLDGKTLRQYVDGVVKMGLKTSSIIMIDSRWETYVGSLLLNTQLFPKWRLLFEIIHNKGFKVVLTMKPYVDTIIGASAVQQLLDSGKLYADTSQRSNELQQDNSGNTATILRRTGLFSFRNETIELAGQDATRRPYVFRCKESQLGYCNLLDLTRDSTRAWLAGHISRSELLASNAVDGISLAGAHPDGFAWEAHYRAGLGELIRSLYFRERIFALPQWTGDLGYIQLAPRPFTWHGLRSVLNSVLNLGFEGFSLIHPGSVWGDLRSSSLLGNMSLSQARKEPAPVLEDFVALERSNEELCIRWLQVGVFLPILQFNNLAFIERYNLQDLLQSLVKIRKLHIIAELKRNLPYTPLIGQSKYNSTSPSSSLIGPVWFNQHQQPNSPDTMVGEQFTIGADILVAPVLSEATRQRDIYLPNGFWHDELRQTDIRGGKWLRNYPVELNEIAWFTRAKR